MIVYYCGRYLAKADVHVSPDDRGLVFADGVYEVVRSYRGRLFRWEAHMARLAHSLEGLRIAGADVTSLADVASRLLRENGLAEAEATIYLQITRGAAPRAHEFPAADTRPTVYLEAKPFSPKNTAQQDGVSVIILPDQRWTRCDLKTTCLLPNILAFQAAREAGAAEAVLSRDGVLLEGTRSSMLFVKGGAILVPPLNNYILGSITRQIALELAAQEQIPVAIESCFEANASQLDELMMVGTTSEIIPVTRIGSRFVGTGTPGPITRRLQAAFRKLTEEVQV
jgi:D-alanine transaminase